MIGKVLADKYRIDSFLSEGALGNFYRATHLLMDKPVSVKILAPAFADDDTAVKRFADEARTVSRVSHPNILNVTDYGSDASGTVFIVYDDAPASTLKNLIGRDGAFSLERAASIVRQTASALTAAHASNIIHRNLSSENILVGETTNGAEIVKVANLGIAQSPNGQLSEFGNGRAVEYLSPEQCAGGDADRRSDVYSLGIVAYEMLAGEVPFAANQPTEVMVKHSEQLPPPLAAFRRDLPAGVEVVLLTALAKNPDSRYQSAEEFAAALSQAALVGNPVGQPSSAPVGVIAREPAQNNLWKTAFIVLAGISLLSAFFIYSTSVKQTDPATQLVTDANGVPVQPVNPATGTTEQSLSNMNSFNPEVFANSNGAATMLPGSVPPTSVAPGGDGYDPWATGRPPAGAPPAYVGPGGQQVYVDGNGSIFMPSDGNTYIMVPKNTNAAANTNPRGKNSNTNTNAATAPAANTAAKPSPAPPAANTATPPAAKPTPAKPAPSPRRTATPAAGETRPPSGAEPNLD